MFREIHEIKKSEKNLYSKRDDDIDFDKRIEIKPESDITEKKADDFWSTVFDPDKRI